MSFPPAISNQTAKDDYLPVQANLCTPDMICICRERVNEILADPRVKEVAERTRRQEFACLSEPALVYPMAVGAPVPRPGPLRPEFALGRAQLVVTACAPLSWMPLSSDDAHFEARTIPRAICHNLHCVRALDAWMCPIHMPSPLQLQHPRALEPTPATRKLQQRSPEIYTIFDGIDE